ncbi:MAG: transcription elongation factor GreA [Candidatus Omnitrophota bacterium]|nr:transcription elongation factor GreA [Candidatus Omnitrophota bacterium]MBU1895239.1 transcription elongation factor GreA [Candidatus Omnitrophota bacterium]
MPGKRIMLTREGRDKMCSELQFLKGEKRRENAKALAEARAHGDLSENAEYDAAKEAQAMNEKKIAELEDTLMRAQLIDNNAISKDEALVGATVKVKDCNTNESFDYTLVSEEESDFDLNKISVSSPVGKAILGHKVGEQVEIKVPAGVLVYEIIKISR